MTRIIRRLIDAVVMWFRRTLKEKMKADPYPKDKFIIAKRHRSSMGGES